MRYDDKQRLLEVIRGLERGELSRTTAAADLRRLMTRMAENEKTKPE